MGLGNQPVQVYPSGVVLCQNDGMVGGKALNDVRVGIAQRVHLFQGILSVLMKHPAEADKNLRRRLRVVHRPVMVFEGNTQSLCHCVQGMLRLVGKQNSCDSHRIHIGIIKGKRLPGRILPNKAGIKARVMRHQHTALAEGQKLRQHLLDGSRSRHHFIVDAGEFFYFKRDGHLGIYKRGKPVRDLPLAVFHLHLDGSDFDDPVFHR